jgi:signal peptidase I
MHVPAEFDLEDVMGEKFKQHNHVQQDALHAGLLKLSDKIYEKGEVALAFNLLLGDALFVDRFSYNFIKPAVGDPIVFQTGEIDEYNDKLRKDGIVTENFPWRPIREDKYYIKRLVGRQGDELIIQPLPNNNQQVGYLLRNGKPITGSKAFDENRKVVDHFRNGTPQSKYPAYRANGLLSAGSIVKVPPNSLFAMGDNSPNSLDGRAWGFVPEEKVVGRAFFVYYPFTRRWGISD